MFRRPFRIRCSLLSVTFRFLCSNRIGKNKYTDFFAVCRAKAAVAKMNGTVHFAEARILLFEKCTFARKKARKTVRLLPCHGTKYEKDPHLGPFSKFRF